MKRLSLFATLALIATACLSPPPDLAELSAEAADDPTVSAEAESDQDQETTESADHHDQDAADHEHDGTESADHHDEEAADHHDEEAADHEHDGTESADHHDEEPVSTEGEVRRLDVVITEFTFDPASITVVEGETVQFFLKNEGVEEHEFRLTTLHAAEEHVASGHEGHHDEGSGDAGGHAHDEMLIIVPAGQSRVFSVTFEHAGEFDIFTCLIPGHFENGMVADLNYES